MPGWIRRVVIQTNCSSIVASSRTDAVVATGTAAAATPFLRLFLILAEPDGWRPLAPTLGDASYCNGPQRQRAHGGMGVRLRRSRL